MTIETEAWWDCVREDTGSFGGSTENEERRAGKCNTEVDVIHRIFGRKDCESFADAASSNLNK